MLIPLLIIVVISIISMVLLIILKPQIKVFRFNLQTFYWPILIGAMLILIFSLLDPQIAFQSLTNNSAINPLKLLIIFLSLSFISIILDETGFLRFWQALLLINPKVRKLNSSLFCTHWCHF